MTRSTALQRSNAAGPRRRSERLGRLAEWLAAGLLLAKGYRLLGHRTRTPYGEIDLIAVRRGRLAFVEVKHRAQLDVAKSAVSRGQAERIARAAEFWTWRRARYRDYEIGLDCIYVAPFAWPRHIPNALQPT